MTAFPEGTTSKDIGAKKGDIFRFIHASNGRFVEGQTVTLSNDDRSMFPLFTPLGGSLEYSCHWHKLEPLEEQPRTPTWETLQEGDVLENKSRSYNAVVQGRIGWIIFYMTSDDSKSDFKNTIEAMKDVGWKIKSTQQQPKKMTVSEVAKALGHEVEIVEG